MEDHLLIVVVAAFILGFGLISGRLKTTVITPPMMFVTFGLLIGPNLFGIFSADIENSVINFIAEVTLILILFTDASRIDLKLLRQEHDIPIRLLVLGLPLTMVAGALVGAVLFDTLTFWEAVILAIILAPTDAALGQAVVSSSRVPVRVRQALNVESGLNDGIALPVLLFFIAVAGSAADVGQGQWLQFAAAQIILGPIVGVAVAYLGGQVVEWAEAKGWVDEAFQKLVALGLALLAFALAELIGGNGFIAAFSAGITLGNFFSSVCNRLYEFIEAEGQLLTLITFMIYGAVMVMPALGQISWQIVLYAILSLTVIRMVPVALSLLRLRLQSATVLFLGWFGPRGIASIIYGLILLDEAALQGEETIFATMVVTVLFSVFAHGLTAVPAANAYGTQTQSMQEEPDRPEMKPVGEMPVRVRFRE